MKPPLAINAIFSVQWAWGYGISLVGGLILAAFVTWLIRKEFDALWRGTPIGLVERAFFTLAVAVELPGVGIAMIAWVTAKMATGWNLTATTACETEKRQRMAALAGGLASMFAATLGGLICAGRIVWNNAT